MKEKLFSIRLTRDEIYSLDLALLLAGNKYRAEEKTLPGPMFTAHEKVLKRLRDKEVYPELWGEE